MIVFDALRERELIDRYQKLAYSIDDYLRSKDSISEGMYLSKKDYEMCSEALKHYSKHNRSLKNVIISWFTKG